MIYVKFMQILILSIFYMRHFQPSYVDVKIQGKCSLGGCVHLGGDFFYMLGMQHKYDTSPIEPNQVVHRILTGYEPGFDVSIAPGDGFLRDITSYSYLRRVLRGRIPLQFSSRHAILRKHLPPTRFSATSTRNIVGYGYPPANDTRRAQIGASGAIRARRQGRKAEAHRWKEVFHHQGSQKEDIFKLVFRKKRIRIRVALVNKGSLRSRILRWIAMKVSTEQDAITIAPEWGLYGAVIQTSVPHSTILQQATSRSLKRRHSSRPPALFPIFTYNERFKRRFYGFNEASKQDVQSRRLMVKKEHVHEELNH